MKPFVVPMKLLLGTLLLTACSLAAAAAYDFKSIDVPGASFTRAFGINDAGHIVGTYFRDFRQHGFVFRDGEFTTIDVPVDPVPADFVTIAYSINNHEQIAGAFNFGLGLSSAFVFENGTFRMVSSNEVLISEARGINDDGTICGTFAFTDKPGLHAYLLRQGMLSIIDVPDSTSTMAFGLNNAEDVVGVYVDAAGTSHGFLSHGGSISTIARPGATDTTPYGINSAGAIVGFFTRNNAKHGFVLVNGKFRTLDFPGASATEAYGINSNGEIVGDYRGADGVFHAFIATPKHQGRDNQGKGSQKENQDQADNQGQGQNNDDNSVMMSPFMGRH